MTEPLLSVSNLEVRFRADEGTVSAVSGVSFTVERGEVVCLVGETGSGKTAACESITRLSNAEINGEIRFDGRELTDLPSRALRDLRGDRIAHVFQQPSSSLDPVYTVGEQIAEAIRLHRDVSRTVARERAVSLLDRVGIAAPRDRVDSYPHELSGGMRQRVAIAIALAADPELLVADEPTTALDVTVQAGVLELLRDLQRERDLAVLLITHDLGVVAELADRVVVLYDGRIVERGPVDAVFDRPAHPYTERLFEAARGDSTEDTRSTESPAESGCAFRPACPYAVDDCTVEYPVFYAVESGSQSSGRVVEYEVGRDATEHAAACVHYAPEYDASVLEGDGE